MREEANIEVIKNTGNYVETDIIEAWLRVWRTVSACCIDEDASDHFLNDFLH